MNFTKAVVTRLPSNFRLVCFLAALPGLLLNAAPPASVKIGYYGPADGSHLVGGTIWQGTKLAMEEANRNGGYRGAPFRLVQGWDENPWSGGAATVARMAFFEQVWAIIGSINGDTTHLAEQVVAKAQVPLIDPASTDRGVNAAFVPWTFSVMPDDRTLMAALVNNLPKGRFVLATSAQHDGRVMEKEFLRLLNGVRRRPYRHFVFRDPADVAPDIAALKVGTVVILAGIRDSATLVRMLRQAQPKLIILGGPAMGRTTFLKRAGRAAGGVRCPLILSPGASGRAFAERFQARYGTAPDFAAYYAYDAARMLVAAIRRGGLDRTAIRNALQQLSPWAGVSGTITWDKIRRNSRPVAVGVIRNGKLEHIPVGKRR